MRRLDFVEHLTEKNLYEENNPRVSYTFHQAVLTPYRLYPFPQGVLVFEGDRIPFHISHFLQRQQ